MGPCGFSEFSYTLFNITSVPKAWRGRSGTQRGKGTSGKLRGNPDAEERINGSNVIWGISVDVIIHAVPMLLVDYC